MGYSIIAQLFIVTILVFLMRIPSSQAGTYQSQTHLGAGMVSSNIGSAIKTAQVGFSVVPSFNAEYELFTSDRSSFVFRGILALDSKTTVTRYFYGGLGQRFYLSRRGAPLNSVTPEISLIEQVKFRYYIGWDAGLSDIVVNVLSSSLQSITTALDFGGCMGGIVQMSNRFGLEFSLGMSYAFGFSSIPSTGTVTKLFFGAVYSF